MQAADLMGTSSRGDRVVTQRGFKYLLRDTYGQLWGLLRPFVALQESEEGEGRAFDGATGSIPHFVPAERQMQPAGGLLLLGFVALQECL